MKAYQAKIGESYFLDVGGWLPPNTPATFVEFDREHAIFSVTDTNGNLAEIVIDKDDSIQELNTKIKP